MKIFVIGATGRTGREVVEQALARGHDVTAFVRSPEAIGLTNEKLTVIKGEATEEDQLVKAMQNHDAVVSTLGPRKPFKPSSLLHDSALATTRTMQRSGVKRLLILSAAAHFPGIFNRIVSLYPAKSHARLVVYGRGRPSQRSELDDRAPSTSYSRKIFELSKSGGCRSQDGFHSIPQSGCGIHARRDRAGETFSESCGHREIISWSFAMFIADRRSLSPCLGGQCLLGHARFHPLRLMCRTI